MDEGKCPRVFISHSSDDLVAAQCFQDILSDFGIDSFVDKDIQKAKKWMETLEKELNGSNFFILLLSENSEKSAFCQQEVGWALGRNIPVLCIPVKCDDDENIRERWRGKNPIGGKEAKERLEIARRILCGKEAGCVHWPGFTQALQHLDMTFKVAEYDVISSKGRRNARSEFYGDEEYQPGHPVEKLIAAVMEDTNYWNYLIDALEDPQGRDNNYRRVQSYRKSIIVANFLYDHKETLGIEHALRIIDRIKSNKQVFECGTAKDTLIKVVNDILDQYDMVYDFEQDQINTRLSD